LYETGGEEAEGVSWEIMIPETAFGYKYGQMAQSPEYFECDKNLIEKAKKFNNVFIGDIVSGDEFVTDNIKMQNKINTYFNDYDILACDMESTSIAHVSYLARVPFIIIRTISDVLDFEGDKRDFSELALESCKLLAHFIKEYVYEG
jgi:adenosylhomocysteine nucleosidase